MFRFVCMGSVSLQKILLCLFILLDSDRLAAKWKELQIEMDQLPQAWSKTWKLFTRGGGDHRETSVQVGEQVSYFSDFQIVYS